MDPSQGPERPSRDGFRVLDAWVEPELDRLTRDGASQHLEPKLTEVLLLLTKHQGHVVSKEKLLETVWPDQFVSESTLSRAIAELRRVLGDDAQKPRFIETIPRRGYRWIAPIERAGPPAPAAPVAAASSRTPEPQGAPPAVAGAAGPAATLRVRRMRWRGGVGLAVLAAVGLALVLYSRAAAPAVSETDVVLVTDFENRTGDPLFDDTLKQAFVIQMEQSPYFSFFPADRIRSTLEMMRRSPDERITPALAREICERNGIAAMLVGSLAPLGESFVITLQAISARTGETLAREQVQAAKREDILSALGGAASELRRKLGESRASIERFDKPLVEATTSSLEALRFYSEGRRLFEAGKFAEAIPFHRKALELDPEFAGAYMQMAACYHMAENDADEMPALRRAYELRHRVTERERYGITFYYLEGEKGDLIGARENLELAVRAYPREARFRSALAGAYLSEGKYAAALEQAAEGKRLLVEAASNVGPDLQRAAALLALGRYDEVKRTVTEILRGLGSTEESEWSEIGAEDAHVLLLSVAFAEGDQAAFQRELDWCRNQEPPAFGVLRAEMELFAGRRDGPALADIPDAQVGERSILAADLAALGDCDGARAELHKMPSDRVDWAQATAFALCGDVEPARQALDRLHAAPPAWPADTRVILLPVAEALLEHSLGDFSLARAKLEPALRFQLGAVDGFWTTYALGLSYLGERRGGEAAAAFEKILAHRGVLPSSPLYPLAYLGLARASTLSGDTARARRAYEDLFAIWKEADPDLPALVAARAEYSRLR